MGLYLKKVLGYPADQASQLLQVWKATVSVFVEGMGKEGVVDYWEQTRRCGSGGRERSSVVKGAGVEKQKVCKVGSTSATQPQSSCRCRGQR